jgi:hypothetical protein
MDEAYQWANGLKDGPSYALGVTKELLRCEADVNLENALGNGGGSPGKMYGNSGLHRGLQCFHRKASAAI